MATSTQSPPIVLKLHAVTAANLMVPNPISIRANASVAEALRLFTDRGVSAAPVIDEGGRPIGVVSRSDLIVHQAEASRRGHGYFFADAETGTFDEDAAASVTVADLMTPAVFAVAPDTHVSRVIGDMLGLHVHRLFVVDDDGVLVGVISTMDVLRRLLP